MKLNKFALLLAICLLLGSCTKPTNTVRLPQPLRGENMEEQEGFELPEQQEPQGPKQTQFKPTPHIVSGYQGPAGARSDDLPDATGTYDVSIDNLPVPAFINEVYGNMLGVSFEISSGLSKSEDVVTLRSGRKLSAAELDTLARQVLANYGVDVQRTADVYRFRVAPKDTQTGEPPLIISGRALPDVPMSHRPVFQLIPLQVVKGSSVAEWISQAYKGHEVTIFNDPIRNAILVMGPPPMVGQVVEAVRLFDQPTMRGRYSERIEPVYLSAEDLADMLGNILSTEGYAVSQNIQGGVGGGEGGSVYILPLEAVNSVIAFASDRQTLRHIRDWVRTLDQPNEMTGARNATGVYYYNVENTNAEDIYEVLVDVVSNLSDAGGVTVNIQGEVSSGETETETQTATGVQGDRIPHSPGRLLEDQDIVTPRRGAATQASAQRSTTVQEERNESGLVVDKSRNALIFQGPRQTWEVLLPIIREMDQQPRMVLVEVTIAEITLTDNEELGIEWLIQEHYGSKAGGGWVGDIGTLGGLGVGGEGFSFILNNAGQTRAVLNAFAQKSRVTILSTPRVMVKSGSTATIDVGKDVPTVSSQSVGNTEGERVYQEIQYRRTGTLLNVTPIVHSGRRIDLEVSQEVSQTLDSTSSTIQSPEIFTRKIETALGLKDGGSVLLGGLISSNNSKGYSGVPVLSDIPVVGRLFRVERDNNDRTELVMLIIPYIIDSDKDAREITDSLKSRLHGIGH